MKTQSLLCVAFVAATLSVGAPAFAEDAAMSPEKHKWCQDNPQKCEEKKAKRAAWCQDNPAQCEKAKARHEEMRKKCEADPVACEKRREERRQRHEEFRKLCETDRAACDKKREEMKQRRQERQGKSGDVAPAKPME